MAGGASGGGDDDELITNINVTPLVDVVLVLLIILMVTATAIVSKTIPMDLPEAKTGEKSKATLAVSLSDKGTLYVDREPVDPKGLRQAVRKARRKNDEVQAVIAADGTIEHRRVVEIIDLLRQEKISHFAINVRPSELAK